MAKKNSQYSLIAKRITSIKGKVTRLKQEIHETAVDCLAQLRDHGDNSLINKLFDAIGTSQRQGALAAWCQEFAPVTVNVKACKVSVVKGWDASDFDLEAAAKTPYWELAGAETIPVLTEADVYGSMFAALSRLDKIEEGKAEARGFDTSVARARIKKGLDAMKLSKADIERMRESRKVLKEQAPTQEQAAATAA